MPDDARARGRKHRSAPAVTPDATAAHLAPAHAVPAGVLLDAPAEDPAAPAIEFDEVTYLRAFPDVLDAVERGELASGWEHYRLSGEAEGRLDKPEYLRLQEVGETGAAAAAGLDAGFAAPAVNVDALLLSRSGAILLIGWGDDGDDPLTSITVLAGDQPYSVWTRFPRLSRPDVGRAISGDPTYPYGFWAFAAPNQRRLSEVGAAVEECLVELHFASGAVADIQRQPRLLSDRDLRDTAMATLSSTAHPDNRTLDSENGLDGRIGAALVEFNRIVSRVGQSAVVTEHFGARRGASLGSIIGPLHHTVDHLFLQSCLFARSVGIANYEIIYIVSHPGLMEPALREARTAEKAYGLTQTLLLTPEETSFGSGLNLAAQMAQSDRLLFIRPDVFPRAADWTTRHDAIVSQMPEASTRLFGTTLYHDNGSLRSAGLYFDQETVIDSAAGAVVQHSDLQAVAYGRGAPMRADDVAVGHPVVAVSAAFLSVERDWFEHLGGFSECYVGGQHEDVDLCLRSLQQGIPAWVHPIPMWQLDLGVPASPAMADAGLILNRWLFNQRWRSVIVPELLGKAPHHPLLRDLAASGPAVARAANLRAQFVGA